MAFSRSAGILLHPTSFPSKYGIGDLGNEAFKFIDFLRDSGQSLWQVFPLGPTGYGDSPYQCFSAFAGNPLLVSPDKLIEDNLITETEIEEYFENDKFNVDFGTVINYKYHILELAYKNFNSKKLFDSEDYNKFISENSYWLEDYALFMAVKDFHDGVLWTEWSSDIAFREEGAIEMWKIKLSKEISFQKFIQFEFDKQWTAVKNYANQLGIKVIGDLPIFIAYDSADLWANKEFFTVDENGKLETVAGVPPDYFSTTGQLWGNPLYRWDKMEENGFAWWLSRFEKMYKMVDIIRIDHFRGFEAYWEIPGDAPTAVNGKWVKAPGQKFFEAVQNKFGEAPILAEDLGVITKEVEELRDNFNFPGMKILQFAFGKDGDKKFLPHNHIQNCVVYTGSHDNDTTKGFFDDARKNSPEIFESAKEYLDSNNENICKVLIKAAYRSVANIVVIPLQDILNLGSDARMNFPGKLGGNWTWRYSDEQLSEEIKNWLNHLSNLYERLPLK